MAGAASVASPSEAAAEGSRRAAKVKEGSRGRLGLEGCPAYPAGHGTAVKVSFYLITAQMTAMNATVQVATSLCSSLMASFGCKARREASCSVASRQSGQA